MNVVCCLYTFLPIRASLASNSLSPSIYFAVHFNLLPLNPSNPTPTMSGKGTRSKKAAAAAAASTTDTNAVADNGVLFNSFYTFCIHTPLLQLVLRPTLALLLLPLRSLPQTLALMYSMTLTKVPRLSSPYQTVSNQLRFGILYR